MFYSERAAQDWAECGAAVEQKMAVVASCTPASASGEGDVHLLSKGTSKGSSPAKGLLDSVAVQEPGYQKALCQDAQSSGSAHTPICIQ